MILVGTVCLTSRERLEHIKHHNKINDIVSVLSFELGTDAHTKPSPCHLQDGTMGLCY